jgi:hypothetical protein
LRWIDSRDRIEATLLDLRFMIQILDLNLRVRNRPAICEDDGAEDTAYPIRIRLIQRHDLNRKAKWFVPAPGNTANVDDRLRDLLDIFVLSLLEIRRGAKNECVVSQRARYASRWIRDICRCFAVDAGPHDRFEVLAEIGHSGFGFGTALADNVELLRRAHAHRVTVIERMREDECERQRLRLTQCGFGRIEELKVR